MLAPPAAPGAVGPGAVVLCEADTPVEPELDWSEPVGTGAGLATLCARASPAPVSVAAVIARVEAVIRRSARVVISTL